jgi:hypothetical protein
VSPEQREEFIALRRAFGLGVVDALGLPAWEYEMLVAALSAPASEPMGTLDSVPDELRDLPMGE